MNREQNGRCCGENSAWSVNVIVEGALRSGPAILKEQEMDQPEVTSPSKVDGLQSLL